MISRSVKLAFVLCASLLASAAGAQRTKLVVASFYPVDKVSGWSGLVSAFKAKHPDVDIEVQVSPVDSYLPKLLSQMVGGSAPDVVAVENNPFPTFVQRGILADLTPYLTRTKGFTTKDFFSFLMDRYTVGGRVYGIPYDAQPFALVYYNPKLFSATKVAPPTNAWTWQDMLGAAQKLTTRQGDSVSRYGFDVDYGDWTYFLNTGGGAFVDNLKAPKKSLLASVPATQALQFYVDLMRKYRVSPTAQTLQATGDGAGISLFLSGKTAMFVSGFWRAVENAQAFKTMGIQVALAPVKNTNKRVYGTGGTAYGITSASKNKDLAWDFITNFLGSSGYREAYKAAPLGAIYPPAHIPSFNWYAQQPITFVNTLQPNKTALQYIRFLPFTGAWTEITAKCITPDVNLALRGEVPVPATMTKVSACVDGELNK